MSRLTDNDTVLGPLRYGKDGWKYTSLKLCSGGDEDGYQHCHIMGYLFGYVFRIRLPRILRPSKVWVDTSKYGWSTNPAGGYWQSWQREYGFSCHEGHFSIYYGQQTHDSSTDKRKGWFLPWTQWRFIRHEIFDADLKSFYRSNGKGSTYDQQQAVSKVAFRLTDYEGEELIAQTYVSEREWKFGTGWCKWLCLFRRNMVRRDLEISFNREAGSDKGSWKGGVMGTSITMLPSENHEQAMRRFCELEHRAKHGRYRLVFGGHV